MLAGGHPALLLDGDEIRAGLNRDLGFSQEDRTENIRRAAEVARLANRSGLWVVAAFISPLRSQRQQAREIIGGMISLKCSSAPVSPSARSAMPRVSMPRHRPGRSASLPG